MSTAALPFSPRVVQVSVSVAPENAFALSYAPPPAIPKTPPALAMSPLTSIPSAFIRSPPAPVPPTPAAGFSIQYVVLITVLGCCSLLVVGTLMAMHFRKKRQLAVNIAVQRRMDQVRPATCDRGGGLGDWVGWWGGVGILWVCEDGWCVWECVRVD